MDRTHADAESCERLDDPSVAWLKASRWRRQTRRRIGLKETELESFFPIEIRETLHWKKGKPQGACSLSYLNYAQNCIGAKSSETDSFAASVMPSNLMT
jgi:hypothetical protein